MPTPNGPKGQPRFDLDDQSDFPADVTDASDYAALVGNRKVLTTAEIAALVGDALWEGLEIRNSTTGLEYIVVNGVLRPADKATYAFAKRSGAAQDSFGAGQFPGLVSAKITGARAGVYIVFGAVNVAAAGLSVGYLRVTAGPDKANLSDDARVDVDTQAGPRPFTYAFVHTADGDLTVEASFQVATQSGTVFRNGTSIGVYRVGTA